MRSIFFRWIIWAGIVLVAAARIHMALTRAFDPDEFAYLHWAWLVAHGFQPYRDFFFYIIPGFPWILSVILWLTGESTTFLLAARIFMAIIYGLCAGVVYRMTKKIIDWIPASAGMTTNAPGTTTALLAVLIFLTFPVTIDKTIDIRPDMVMLLLYFASAWLILQPEKVRPFQAKYVVSGIVFGGSVLVLPKIIFSLPAILYLFISQNYVRPNFSRPPLANAKGVAFNSVLAWIIGAGITGLGFLGYLAFNHLIPQAITSITKDALAVTSGKGSFSPLTLLSPYPLIYLSSGGISLPWAINTGFWILGIVGLFVLFKMNRPWAIFWSLFIAGNIFFVVLFPVPYVQYLLPLSVAGSVLAGFALSVIPGPLSRSVSLASPERYTKASEASLIRNPAQKYWIPASAGMTNNIIIVITILFPLPLLLSSFFLQYRERVAPGAGDPEQLQVIRDVLRVTKPDESVYDMVGSYVFRPDGYYICCHPYAEFVHKLGSSLPARLDSAKRNEVPPSGTKEGPGLNLTTSLIARHTKFLVMDRVGFVFWKSLEADKFFLLTNYLPMGNPAAPKMPLAKLYSLGLSFRCQQAACVQYDMDGKPAATRSTNTFTIIAAENYTVSVEPNSSSIMIDGKEMQNNQTIELAKGPHRFMTDQTTTAFRLQVKRNEEVLREHRR